MRVFVTGGAGFIGSNLVRALLSGGNDVAIADDLSTGKADNLDPRAQFRALDILEPSLAGYLAEFRPDAVVHLAAQSSVPASLKDPERDRLVNAEGTRLVAAAARGAGAKRVISASSAAVYGDPVELPLVETSRTEPVNPYGVSKLEAESLLAEELDGSGTDYASFRFSNVYGPRQDAQGEGGVVALFLDAVSAGRTPVVFGDGRQTRDFIYVGDVVGAIIAALAAGGPLGHGAGPESAYNISTGRRTSVEELLMAVRQAANYLGGVERRDPREGDIDHSVLSPEKAQAALGWHAGVELTTGIPLTWRWYSAAR